MQNCKLLSKINIEKNMQPICRCLWIQL